TVTGRSDTDIDAMALHDTQTIVFAPIPASTEYWVRNVTNPNGEGDAGYATADQSYYGTGGQVKASAGDELEYIIVQSAGNTGDLNDVEITATMPLFTTYIGNSTYLNGQEQADPPADPAQSLLIAGLDAGTIVRHGEANVAFRVIVDAIPESDQGDQGQGQSSAPANDQLVVIQVDAPFCIDGTCHTTQECWDNLTAEDYSGTGFSYAGVGSNRSITALECGDSAIARHRAGVDMNVTVSYPESRTGVFRSYAGVRNQITLNIPAGMQYLYVEKEAGANIQINVERQ
ncbi:MAG: hypothetical protein QGF90_14645, partial [Gammaproteobacteria bacterium]|nr:hypothetical protein [Gammaproteobacteria bacterium]